MLLNSLYSLAIDQSSISAQLTWAACWSCSAQPADIPAPTIPRSSAGPTLTADRAGLVWEFGLTQLAALCVVAMSQGRLRAA
jgi:hypothetical protein